MQRTLNPHRAKRDPPYRPLPTTTVLHALTQFRCYLMRLAVNECQRFGPFLLPCVLPGVAASLPRSNPPRSCRDQGALGGWCFSRGGDPVERTALE
jgi:hypothetical protein